MSSRRPGADKAAANQNTIKQLLKLEGNKICADCKRNKHPRWASWNLGIFICIRCSGIHRGMGTHISRVKSVDLDAWTDEQLQSVLKWGNTRANKYWEAKLAPGHVPSEAKLENYIRTKYDSKRWVMDGPMPDPSTLGGEGDDDVPLNVVKEKATLDRAASQRASSSAAVAPPPRRQPQPSIDLFGDDPPAPPARPSTTDNVVPRKPDQPQAPAPPKQRPGDSLLGLDFFGSSQSSGPARPSSAAATPAGQSSRPDLKQSILSLYASAPKPQAQPAAHDRKSSFGGPVAQPTQNDAFGGLSDAFGGLNFGSGTTSPAAPRPSSSAFADLGSLASPMSNKATPAPAQVTSPLSGGGFFDTAPKPAAPQPARAPSNGLNFGFAQQAAAAPAPPKPTTSSSRDLFDDDFGGFASSEPPPPPPPSKVTSPPLQSSNMNIASAFNLSNPAPIPTVTKPPPPQPAASSSALFDPWGSEPNAWSNPDPTPAPQPSAAAKPLSPSLGRPPAHITPNDISGGWGAPLSSANNKKSAQPTVAADEDFGGWTSATTPSAAPAMASSGGGGGNHGASTGQKQGGGGFGGTSEDLFSNVWE